MSTINLSDYSTKGTAILTWYLNVSSIEQCPSDIASPQFACENMEGANNGPYFILYLYPFFEYRGTLLFGLYTFSEDIDVKYKVTIYNSDTAKNIITENVYSYSFYNNNNVIGSTFTTHLIEPSNGFVTDGKIKIRCEVNILEKITQSRAHSSPKVPEIVHSYRELLNSEKLSDLVLVAGGQKFKVHKAILSVRSKVFAAMFEHDTEEKRRNQIDIPDLDATVCSEMLRHIYTGMVESMEQNAVALLIAADKYELDQLKRQCEEWLATTLTIELVPCILQFSDMHQANLLKERCIEYIIDNLSAVMATESWKQLKSTPDLLMNLLQQVATNRQANDVFKNKIK